MCLLLYIVIVIQEWLFRKTFSSTRMKWRVMNLGKDSSLISCLSCIVFFFVGAAKPPTGVYQTQVSSPTRGPVMFPGGITSVNQAPSPHRTGSPTGARYPAGNNSMSYARAAPSPSNGSMKSPPPTARKPTIPPQRKYWSLHWVQWESFIHR